MAGVPIWTTWEHGTVGSVCVCVLHRGSRSCPILCVWGVGHVGRLVTALDLIRLCLKELTSLGVQ